MAVKQVTTVGRRKTSNARAVIKQSEAGAEESIISVNDHEFRAYFPRLASQRAILRTLEIAERVGKYDFRINVRGGGKAGQVGAVIHAIARALQKVEPELRPALKKAGFLTRDPRVVERKKPGRHKARKSTQFSKR